MGYKRKGLGPTQQDESNKKLYLNWDPKDYTLTVRVCKK